MRYSFLTTGFRLRAIAPATELGIFNATRARLSSYKIGDAIDGEVKPPQPCFRGISSLYATATYCMHSDRTPGGIPAGGSTNAGAIDHVITGTACMADLGEHTVRLIKAWTLNGTHRCCG